MWLVHKCGLFINFGIPSLAATPDFLVSKGDGDMGCLELKYPFVRVERYSILSSADPVFHGLIGHVWFCCMGSRRRYVFMLEKIFCDRMFIKEAVSKARAFYFDNFYHL